MVDFACDQDGSPILAVSSLAIHSKVRFFLFLFAFMILYTKPFVLPFHVHYAWMPYNLVASLENKSKPMCGRTKKYA
jgi:hypothetical protein